MHWIIKMLEYVGRQRISLTEGPAAPTGPEGPTTPFSPLGPLVPFSPLAPGWPAAPCWGKRGEHRPSNPLWCCQIHLP